ncbi:MAG: helix-turn-helix transcriptional regulator [Candidatus Carbobacillus sp.]|nr:helix-turn-helix transcriptional regulator [Candidatus Carbobacillus sp.]
MDRQNSGETSTFLATREEIAQIHDGLLRQHVHPSCGQKRGRSTKPPATVSDHLLSFISRLRSCYLRYAEAGMFLPDFQLVITDSDLRVIEVVRSSGKSHDEKQYNHAVSHVTFVHPDIHPGDTLDEDTYGVSAFVLARAFLTMRLLSGPFHTCPQFQTSWTVAVPFGCHREQRLLGVAGLIFSESRDPYGYGGWLFEVVKKIERVCKNEEQLVDTKAHHNVLRNAHGESAPSWRIVRPMLAVRLPYGVIEQLTERERDVLALWVAGMNSVEIAETLHVSSSTIRTYFTRISDKLGVEPGVQSIRAFLETEIARENLKEKENV